MVSVSHERIGYGAIDKEGNPTTKTDGEKKIKEQSQGTTATVTSHESPYLGRQYYHRCFWEYVSIRFCILLLLSVSVLVISAVFFTGSIVPLDRSSGPWQQRVTIFGRNDDGHNSIAQNAVIIEEESKAGSPTPTLKSGKTLMSPRRFSSALPSSPLLSTSRNIESSSITAANSISSSNNNNNNSTTSTIGLSKRLFQANLDLAHEAYQTHYLQNLTLGTLNPNYYGQYSIQDIAYCAVGLEDWKQVRDRSTIPEIHRFAAERVGTWEWYIATTYSEWHIANPAESVVLSDAARRYVEFEKKVCNEYDPVYAAVVMAPCDRLWNWVANQMKRDVLGATGGESGKNNVYWGWIEDNASYEDGASELEKFIDANEEIIDEDLAMRVYRTAMMGEVNFFRSAGRQPGLPTSLL